MKLNDKYIHFKGGNYKFIGIAVPLEHHTDTVNSPTRTFIAKKEETVEEMIVYSKDGIMFTENDVFMVVYQSLKDGEKWLRPVDDFFGFKRHQDGSMERRFTLQAEKGEATEHVC